MYLQRDGQAELTWIDAYILEVHRLSADNRYRPIIGQFADNQYRSFDNRPIICSSKQNNKKSF